MIPKTVKENLELTTVPIIEWTMLKDWPCNHLQKRSAREIILDKKISEDSFALIAQDKLLDPLCPEKSVLIFDHGIHPSDRDFVLVYIARDDRIVFNRLFIDNEEKFIKQSLDDGNIKLIRLNKNNDRIIGTLMEIRIPY